MQGQLLSISEQLNVCCMTLTPCGHQGNCKLLLPWGRSLDADV